MLQGEAEHLEGGVEEVEPWDFFPRPQYTSSIYLGINIYIWKPGDYKKDFYVHKTFM